MSTSPASTWCAPARTASYVLEDNVRTPSGVSYMLENREVMMRLFPELFAEHRVAPVETYTDALLHDPALGGAGQRPAASRPSSLLTPGPATTPPTTSTPSWPTSSASSWSRASDLFVRDDVVFMRTTEGPRRVDVIYRRIDDDFLDPLVFRPDSALGVPGLMGAYEAGNVDPGQCAGHRRRRRQGGLQLHARDHPLLHRRGADPAERADLALPRAGRPGLCAGHLPSWWSRRSTARAATACWSGRRATKAEIEAFRASCIRPTRTGFIAQPTLALSTCPTFVDAGVAPRHVDLRPFVLTGADGVRDHARRPDPGGAEGRVAGGQLQPGRRHQGHLGAG